VDCIFSVSYLIEYLHECWIYPLSLEVALYKVEEGRVYNNVAFPNGLDCLNEGVINSNLILVKDVICLDNYV
jgi:hypothetical protein